MKEIAVNKSARECFAEFNEATAREIVWILLFLRWKIETSNIFNNNLIVRFYCYSSPNYKGNPITFGNFDFVLKTLISLEGVVLLGLGMN